MVKIKFKYLLFVLLCCGLYNCTPNASQASLKQNIRFDSTIKTIHVFVALCDNKYQGIQPVPAAIGNGQDPDNNLYWGCAYGIRSYFGKSADWILLNKTRKQGIIMERLIFKHKTRNILLIADAYNGQYIKECTKDFLYSCSGQLKDTVRVNNKIVGINGNAALVAYIGHDGLMDFQLIERFKNTDGKQRSCIILACKSKDFFGKKLEETGAFPLVWTTGLMCPEAYTVHDAISGFINNETKESIRNRAALAYVKYQKCSLKAARGLLVSGW